MLHVLLDNFLPTTLVVQVEQSVGCVCLCVSGRKLSNEWPLTYVFDTVVHLHRIYVMFEGQDRRSKLGSGLG